MNVSLLSGKVAIVTGAGRGLGREYALALAAAGASVVVNDLAANHRAINDAVQEISSHGAVAVANTADVADWQQAESIVQAALTKFGRLDIVINNAGINQPSSLVGLSERDVDSQIGVHLKGTLAVSHFAAAHWSTVVPATGRAIVNTSSAVGLHPTAGDGVYGAAKSAIAALTVSHAQELAQFGVRVNAIAPCARTPMVREAPAVLALMPEVDGFDRHAPEHIAPLVVYLASSLCRFTARTFAIEGPDIAIYRSFSVEHKWSTTQAWTPDEIAKVLSEINEQTETQAFFPGGVVPHSTPPGRTLRTIAELARSEGLEPPTL